MVDDILSRRQIPLVFRQERGENFSLDRLESLRDGQSVVRICFIVYRRSLSLVEEIHPQTPILRRGGRRRFSGPCLVALENLIGRQRPVVDGKPRQISIPVTFPCRRIAEDKAERPFGYPGEHLVIGIGTHEFSIDIDGCSPVPRSDRQKAILVF